MENTSKNGPHFHPIINGLQKMALYTTRSRCYLIGSNNTQKKFRVLKIDRTELHDLVLTDDNVEYSQAEIKELLLMIGGGNKLSVRSSNTKPLSGVTRTVSAFGIFGFIRFMEGYYLILITKRRKVAVIGYHSIYKVEDTSITYIPHESVRKVHDHEQRYVKLLSNIDLTSNFYFSYTYDLTNSLQFNMLPLRNTTAETQDKSESFMNASLFGDSSYLTNDSSKSNNFAYRSPPSDKFVWNSFLLEPLLKGNAHPCWILPITQGFIAQSNISVYNRPFYLTLIARRSTTYAGTRFLKRGANCDGDVANEVETEQIVHDAHLSSLEYGRFTSFVQVRGSIPCHWSQDISKMVPKPPITIDAHDPYAETAGKHFNKLFKRFGCPVIALNLVKKREKKRHESILNEEYKRLLQQLNLTLPPSARIQHIAVDMARINKNKKENLMNRLADIGFQTIDKTGIFQNFPTYYVHRENSSFQSSNSNIVQGSSFDENHIELKKFYEENMRLQKGIVRVNCVDCLDRTNTAQFCLGKCALAVQLYRLGVLEKPSIEFDSACVRILEEMYGVHGDTLALQYGGSQLVHRIATYRKTAPWSSHGNDIMQSLSRYLSNTFSDQEKQQAINLFLGVFVPLLQSQPIWEISSDYLFHHPLARNIWPCHKRSTSQWWEDDVVKFLPFALDQINKKAEILIPVTKNDPRIDLYGDFYRPFEFSVMSESFTYQLNHSSSYLYGNDYTQVNLDESPFSVRCRRSRSKEDVSNSPSRGFLNKAPSAGETTKKFNVFRPFSSTSSSPAPPPSDVSSSDSGESEEETASGFDVETELDGENSSVIAPMSFDVIFTSSEDAYGCIISSISTHDQEIYNRFIHVDNQVSIPFDRSDDNITCSSEQLQFESLMTNPFDNSYEIRPPTVYDFSTKSYSEYVSSGFKGPTLPKHEDILKYQIFASASKIC